jgi:asparagine synthase (glutamine-hydrolysing)
LREWAETLLDERVLREQGLVDVASVRRKWSDHLAGRRNWQYCLWDVLMLQAWVAEHHPGAAAAL